MDYSLFNKELSNLDILNNITELEEVVETFNNTSIDLDCDYPYIIFNTEELVTVLNLCSKIAILKSNSYSYNSIALVPCISFKTLYFYSTNELSHFRYSVELLGKQEEMFNDRISIPLAILQKLVKLMGNKVLIYKKDTDFYIRLQNGDLLLDYRPADENIIFFPNKPTEKIFETKLDKLNSIVEPMLPLLNSDINIENKRLNFTGEKICFNSSLFYIESDFKSPKMSISVKDLEFISRLFKYYKDKSILLFKTDSKDLPRLYLRCDKVEYEFISTSLMSDLSITQMSSLLVKSQFKINFQDLFKIVNLSTMLSLSSESIKLKCNSNSIDIILLSQKGSSKFNLVINKANSDLYMKEISCYSNLFKKLLLPFGKSEEIEVAFSDTSICIYNDYIKAVLIAYN